MGYRSKLDIIADMLNVAGEGAKKTQIMYQANLSYKLLTKYLTVARRAYLVTFERKQRHYVLTQKGRRFLDVYKDYSRRNKYVEKHLTDANGKRRMLEGLCSGRGCVENLKIE